VPVSAAQGDPIQNLHHAMSQVVSLGASDLHLKAGAPPYVRLNGELVPIPGTYANSSEDMDKVVRELARHAPNRLREFEQCGETDIAYELRNTARFRVNIYRQRGQISVALRVIPEEVPRLEDLNLPTVIQTLAHIPRGLILLTGATGSGKTTTLAAMIDFINENYQRHIVTVEDPIEITHRDKKSLIQQREIGLDTGSFSSALRRALRQDPDVILIGEMRDEETVRTALSAAETGHLVLSTLHTIDVMESIYRILDFFPPQLERQARSMLAGSLKGIVSQRLVRTGDGRSRVPAVEVLVGTSRISDCIARPEDTEHIHDALAEGGYYGMQTFDQSLLQLVVEGVVTIEEAMFHATSKQNFALLLEAHSVKIDRDLRRRASGSMTSVQDDEYYDELRRDALAQTTAGQLGGVPAGPGAGPGAGAGGPAGGPQMPGAAPAMPAAPGMPGGPQMPGHGMMGGPIGPGQGGMPMGMPGGQGPGPGPGHGPGPGPGQGPQWPQQQGNGMMHPGGYPGQGAA
jgi:twitching motility protein PilT